MRRVLGVGGLSAKLPTIDKAVCCGALGGES